MTKFRFVIEAFSKTQCLQLLLGRQILELLGLVSRLGDCPMGAVTAQHVANYVLDPNASEDQVSIRTQLVREFWRWCGNEGVMQARPNWNPPGTLLRAQAARCCPWSRPRPCWHRLVGHGPFRTWHRACSLALTTLPRSALFAGRMPRA